jgi:hypothetical protein
MDTEVTQPTAADIPTPSTADATAATPFDTAFPGSDALRDYGQRLAEALRAKGQELAEPAKRRALWPVAVATLAGVIAARDLLFTSAGPTRASAMSTAAAGHVAETSEKSAGEALPARPSPLRAWLDEPVAPVERNIFTFAGSADAGSDELVRTEAKLVAGSSDAQQWREGSAAEAAEAASSPATDVPGQRAAASGPAGGSKLRVRQVRLQSTLMGAQPTALIDGQMVREGDVVATGSGSARSVYRVLKIEARRVILEREGIRAEVPLE